MRSTAVYTAGRGLVFAAAVGLGWVAGLRGFLLVVVALLVSVPASWVLLARQRNAMAADLERTVQTRRSRRADLRAQLRGDDEPAG